ncbi:hypothetical protein MBOT_10710 [Mycobacterium botniense]|uniref:Uncharacterized protein n=1 Tax=Mycobacterium botniense TaxID=84962 RepID=A0A7I9XVE6_9MYCO|nr:hypothetical protein MBOT_10710 [Mycobacterium botniense]
MENVLRQSLVYQACRTLPTRMRKILMDLVKRQLPEGYDVETHFGPATTRGTNGCA